MWQELERIPWRMLRHNYGRATDVPELLRGSADPDPARATDAFADLYNVLYHQGGWVCPAATAALPFLLELALEPVVHGRDEVVELITRLAREATLVAPRFLDEGWPAALHLAAPRMIMLLDDPDPAVRGEATLLVAEGGLPTAVSISELSRRSREEADPVIRRDLLLALGSVLTRQPDAADVRAELHRRLTDDDPQVRLAAVHALAGSEPDVPAAHVATLVEAVRHEDADDWQRSAWIGGTRATVIRTTGALLRSDPVAATAFTIGVSQDADTDQQVATIGEAGRLLAEWRTVTDALLPFLAEQLRSPHTELRYRAAFLLGCLGTEATAQADRLAELLDDASVRDTRLHRTVGDAAVWALARQHDPRCLSGLAQRLRGGRLGFDSRSSHHGRDIFPFWLPGIHEVLRPLVAYADHLLDAVLVHLGGTADPVLRSLLCDLLGAWGPDARAAVPALLPLLDDDGQWPAAARALGGIGPAAAPAADGLWRRAGAGDPAGAWAFWRVTGEPEPAVRRLLLGLDSGATSAVLRHLGDLGHLADVAGPRLRQLTESPDDWVRVEAAYALWRVSGELDLTVPALTGIARPVTEGRCRPVTRAAIRYLAAIGAPVASATPIARSVLANPRRLADGGGWRAFTEDEEVRAAAAVLDAR